MDDWVFISLSLKQTNPKLFFLEENQAMSQATAGNTSSLETHFCYPQGKYHELKHNSTRVSLPLPWCLGKVSQSWSEATWHPVKTQRCPHLPHLVPLVPQTEMQEPTSGDETRIMCFWCLNLVQTRINTNGKSQPMSSFRLWSET